MPLINETDLWSLAKRALAPADRPAEHNPPQWPPAQDTSRISRSVPLHDVLTARRSVRRFREDPVPDTDLATLLDLATSTDRQMWPHGTAATTPQAWLVSGVAGTSGARLRQYVPRQSPAGPATAVEPLAGEFTDHGDSPEPALLAARYAPAPVTVLICAEITDDTGTAADDTGSDYGRALLRASSFGYNAWLSAVAAGLGGSVYGRSSPEVTRIVRRHTGTPARHLFTLVLGHPAESPQEFGP
ncbi:nitroreductase family protein [Streptomyces griseus]|uniref:nitroreductase family protein n=1 Tax=Streptomyces TaxID=1883 RepID=UPI0001C1CE9D|nr:MULTISPECIES: nitroreductase family protein [Streptomyces]EGE40074.1 nitroreductase [Streptomyces sp. ACT-1]